MTSCNKEREADSKLDRTDNNLHKIGRNCGITGTAYFHRFKQLTCN